MIIFHTPKLPPIRSRARYRRRPESTPATRQAFSQMKRQKAIFDYRESTRTNFQFISPADI